MKFQTFCDNTWLYPDTILNEQTICHEAFAARGGTVGFQILTDTVFDNKTPVSINIQTPNGITCRPYQLLPTHVEANSGLKTHVANDYSEVSHFVTRQAPFDVYDVTRLLDDNILDSGRLGLYLLWEVDANIEPDIYEIVFNLNAGENKLTLPIKLNVSKCIIPALKEAKFGMVNWLFLADVASAHNVTHGSDEFWQIVRNYLSNQLDLRTNHIMLSSGVPVRDADGKVVDFDFSECETLGTMALDAGFSYIYGGFTARFKNWNEPSNYLLWDRDVDTSSIEGYRQLKIYYTKLNALVERRGWQNVWMQCLVDEPQFYNSESYRALSGICRKCMPGVRIHDPVETTEIGGAVDIWCVKQAVFEKHLQNFQRLQEMGEEMWVYTCGFPAGSTMNRATDLPMLAGRLPMWMCVKYGMKGFLHWGYNAYSGRDPFKFNCFATAGKPLPPGNGFIVYPGSDGRPWNSLRAHVQRAGAEDYEILMQIPESERLQFVSRVCETFDIYNPDTQNFAEVRKDLLQYFCE